MATLAVPPASRVRRPSVQYYRQPMRLPIIDSSPVLVLDVLIDLAVLQVRVNAERTVEQLARHVEQLYREAHPDAAQLVCCLFMDEESVPLHFGSVVGDVLTTHSVILAVTERATPDRSFIFESLDRFPTTPSRDTDGDAVIDVAVDEEEHISDQTFEDAMSNLIVLAHFRDYCTSEYALENLLFWLDVEVFHSLAHSGDARCGSFARRIYENYLAQNAPLPVNIGLDVRAAIPASGECSSVDTFDDAQAHVHTMLKSHFFKQFRRSDAFRALEIAKEERGDEFAAAQVDDLGGYFAGKLPDLKETPVGVLSGLLKLYWSECPRAAKEYIAQKEAVLSQQKQRRIAKEKKLLKFFGERPATAELTLQVAAVLPPVRPVDILTASDEPADEPPMSPSQLRRNKERADRLESFFGDRPPASSADEDDAQLRPPTTNQLSDEEKKARAKQSRKLREILGEPIGEDLKPVSANSSPRLEALRFFRSRSESFSTTSSAPSSPPLRPFATSPAMTPSSPSGRPLAVRVGRRPSLEELHRLMVARQRVLLGAGDGDDGPLGAAPISKERRQRKLAKLHSFLGERLSAHVLESQDPAEQAAAAEAATLVGEDKRRQQRTLYKLSRVFGELPPAELVICADDPWAVRSRKALRTLTYLVASDADADLADLVAFMNQVDAEEAALEDGNEDDAETARRVARQRKVNKLNQFFGDPLTEKILLEHKVLSDLVESFVSEAAEEPAKSDYKEDVQTLMAQMQRRASVQGAAMPPIVEAESPPTVA